MLRLTRIALAGGQGGTVGGHGARRWAHIHVVVDLPRSNFQGRPEGAIAGIHRGATARDGIIIRIRAGRRGVRGRPWWIPSGTVFLFGILTTFALSITSPEGGALPGAGPRELTRNTLAVFAARGVISGSSPWSDGLAGGRDPKAI